VRTTRDGEEVNVGDIQIGPGHRLGGKVTLSDGASMKEGMHVTLIFGGRQGDSQTALM
jgi:hypothetical protein